MRVSPFEKINSNYCPNCHKETLSVITNGNKANPIIISYICKNCNHKYMINWTDYKNPRPMYIDYTILIKTIQI